MNNVVVVVVHDDDDVGIYVNHLNDFIFINLLNKNEFLWNRQRQKKTKPIKSFVFKRICR